jgi:hypothetical protein
MFGFCGQHLYQKKKKGKNERKKGGNGNRSVELHYAIATSSKLCQTSPSNLLG